MAAGTAAVDAAVAAGASSNPNVAKIAMQQQQKRTDVVEPQVISEDLLVNGVEEPVRYDGVEKWEPIDFPRVTSLRLSWKNIIEVSNLNNFDMLTTLRLDNNIIDKIANLSHLKQLTWLDLSFNNIRDIEGLDELSNLQDLSLYHNQIEEIRGLDGCPKLNILSLGHNNIKDLKQIDYLRKFQNLRCVCLDGNKVTQHDSYNQHVLAYLPTLKYLDYMLIDRKAVAQAQEGYNLDELVEVREREHQESTKRKNQKEKARVCEKLKGAFLDATEDLFEELFSKEIEPEAVTVLTCYAPLREDYKEQLLEDIKALRQGMDAKNEERTKKVVAFEKAIAKAEKESEDEAYQMIRDFRSHKKKVLAQLNDDSGSLRPEMEAMVSSLLEQLTGLEKHLMDHEILLQESIAEALGDFEGKVGEIVSAMSTRGGDFFRLLEEMDRVFNTSLLEGLNSEIEAYSQSQDLATTDHDLTKQRFFQNKDEMNTAVTGFAEAHTTLIQNKTDYMEEQIKYWKQSYPERHKERQYHRNRQRVMDVKKVIDDCRAEINAAADVGDEYEDADGGENFH